MNVAILGYGSIAENHARAMADLREAAPSDGPVLVGVMGPTAEPTAAFARAHGASVATTDLDEILVDPRVDAVVICSPSPVHADQTERALRAGKHVLCEIPLALSLADADRLIRLADEVDRRLMVCHTRRFDPATAEARRRVESGELRVHAVVGRYLFDRRENVNWKGRRRSWTDNLLWHHGCHLVDAALWIAGAAEPDAVVETVAQVARPGTDLGIPMDIGLVVRTRRDQILTLSLSYHARIAVADALVIGEETTLRLTDGRLWDGDRLVTDASPADGLGSAIARQNAEFFAAVREGREPTVSARSVRPALAVLATAQTTLDVRLASPEAVPGDAPRP